MRRFMGRAAFVALALACGAGVGAGTAGAASAPNAVPGASYEAKGTKLVVDAAGTSVTVQQLPVHAACKGAAPSNEGDYGSSGLGPFRIAANGTFTNIANGAKPSATQTVIKGKFAGARVTGTVVEPAFNDKGFDCAKFSGPWSATRVAGTGDTTKPGATYATDDFSKSDSGFDAFNQTGSYAEYLPDGRFRIGTRQSAASASFRAQPTTATADIAVTTGFTTGSGGDGAGLACAATNPTTYVAGYVALDGQAHVVRFTNGHVVESAPVTDLPAGLLVSGAQAQNQLRLVCRPGTTTGTTNVTLSLNGTKVADAKASTGGAGRVGLFVNGDSGTSEFTFSRFSVKKPAA
ncbi:MAG: hypothetical protein QOF40_848 [Actinomycetota bacterium]|nr:hypothetical protein [Actinomycetota bacterium]